MQTLEQPSVSFTPGPWSAGEPNDHSLCVPVKDEDGCAIANVWGRNEEALANAALIAAAPDLYEALAAIAYLRPAGDCKNELIVQMERIALAALVKARGTPHD